ncbi:MAG TPA: tetratricopeptide repeat protein, partial [Planctomycetaceae bacterium]|nr:tetratricopeptide repeat protein [Planctomycetaceae bacterium]
AEAQEAFESAGKAGAEAAQVAVGVSRCLAAEGKYAEAREVVGKALENSKGSALLSARLARLQFEAGDYEGAEASVVAALKIDPEFAPARLVRADLLTETGHLTEADEEFKWFVRMYNLRQPKDAETLMLVARGSAQYARWHSSSQIFDFMVNTLCPDALAADKQCWEAHEMAGLLLLEKFNRAEAVPELRRALAINPRAAEVYSLLADSDLQSFDLADARKNVDRALEINPNLVSALQFKADLEFNDDKPHEALAVLQKALEINPRDQRTLARLAASYLLLDGAPPAAELKEVLQNIDAPADVRLDKPSRFSQLVLKLAAGNAHPGAFFSQLGEELEERKKFELAQQFYETAMRVMPQLAEAKTALGMLYMRVGKSEQAHKILDEAFKADPYHVRVSNMRKVLTLLDGYETISTDHFVIRVDSEADKILGKYMAEYLEEIYPELTKQFGYEPPARTQFEIFSKAKGLSAHQWFSARMVGLPWIQTIGASTGMIVALASPTAQDQHFNWARVLKHEFVHILTLQETQFNIPHWFTEALAVHNEGYARPEVWNKLLVERVPKGDLMNLDNLNMGFIRPKTPLDWQMAYCQSHLYALYMIEKFGADKIPQLLAAYRDNLTTAQAIPKVFGVSKEEFEKGYLEYIKRVTESIKASSDEHLGTLSELEKAHEADPDDSEATARYAAGMFKAKRYKDARKLAEAALKQNPAEPFAAIVMAQMELRAEDTDAAAKHLEAAFDEQHPNPMVLTLLSKLRVQQEKYADAVKLLELGLKQDPHNHTSLKQIAIAYLKTNQSEKLKDVLLKLAHADADDAPARKKLAQIYFDEKNYAEAVKYGRQVLQIDVLDVKMHSLLADAYTALKDPSHAADEAGVAAEIKPKDVDLALAAAKAEIAADRKAAAETRLRGLIKTDPGNTEAQKLLRQLMD